MINQIATYSNVNDCFISWKCFIVDLLTTSLSFWVLVYDSAEKQMLNAISLVIEQRKNEFDKIAKVRFSPHLFLGLARVISLSRHLSGSIYSRGIDITSTQNLLISFKPIKCKLNYSHVKICDKVCQWLATGLWFSPDSLVSSTNKTDCHDITEILVTVALSIINLNLCCD